MPADKKGIEAVKAVQVAANEVAILLIKKFKDGVQGKDVVEVIGEALKEGPFKNKMKAAYDAVKDFKAEAADIDAAEAVELGIIQLGYVPKILEAVKAEA